MSKFKEGDIITDNELVLAAEVIQVDVDGDCIEILVVDHEFVENVGNETWVNAGSFSFKEVPLATEAPVHLKSAAQQSNNLTDFSLENIFAMRMF
jgi:hypothetical protein